MVFMHHVTNGEIKMTAFIFKNNQSYKWLYDCLDLDLFLKMLPAYNQESLV